MALATTIKKKFEPVCILKRSFDRKMMTFPLNLHTTFIFLDYWIHQPIAQILRKWSGSLGLSTFWRPPNFTVSRFAWDPFTFWEAPYAKKKIKRELKCAQTKKERKSLHPAEDFLIFTFKYVIISFDMYEKSVSINLFSKSNILEWKSFSGGFSYFLQSKIKF